MRFEDLLIIFSIFAIIVAVTVSLVLLDTI